MARVLGHGPNDFETPQLSADLRALPSRTQVTRHDCVEGWSAIGKWKGVPLTAVLAAVRPTAAARYVMFYCADPMESDGSSPYYESIDMDDAYHPQTILAYELNDKALPIANGAPIRLRVERQLGYKHAKYVMRIELDPSLAREKLGWQAAMPLHHGLARTYKFFNDGAR